MEKETTPKKEATHEKKISTNSSHSYAVLSSAPASFLEEGMEETLHRLGLFKQLGICFKTTNCLPMLRAAMKQHLDQMKEAA